MTKSVFRSSKKATAVDLTQVREYWTRNLNLTQFLDSQDGQAQVGGTEFYEEVRASLDRFEYKRPLLESMWDQRCGERLIEIGCGLGADLVELACLGFDVVGVDLSERAAELANKHLQTLNVRGLTRTGNAENLPYEDGSFDEIYSSGVFQHTPHPQRAVDEAIRVLRPGGQLTVILYHRHSWFWLLSRLGRVNVEFQKEEAPIVESYTRKELRHMFGVLDQLSIKMEHYRPVRTPRAGPLAATYNRILVPAVKLLPAALLRPFGFHAIIRGKKRDL